jgi:hypothetical protein
MSKVFFVALCIALIASVALGQVTLSWGEDHFIRGLPTVLNINTVNTQLSGLSLTIKSTSFDFNSLGSKTAYTAALGRFSGYNQPTCVDAVTGQYVASISPASTSMQLGSIQANVDDTITNGKYPDHQIKCFIPHPIFQTAEDVLVDVSGQDSNGSINVEVTITSPAKGFVAPLIEFKSAKVSNIAKTRSGTSSLDIEFTTDVTGLHRIDVDNGQALSRLDYTTGKVGNLWCSSGKEKSFAEILVHSNDDGDDEFFVVVNKVPDSKNTIKCTFPIYSNNYQVWNEQINISVNVGPSTVYRPVTFVPIVGTVSTYGSIGSSESQIYVQFVAAQAKINSTIELTFSQHIDTSYLVIDTGSQEYREWACSAPNGSTAFRGNIAVKGQTLLITDIDRVPDQQFTCTFYFAGAKFFKFVDNAQQASVTVKVDDVTLQSNNSPGTDAKLYFGTSSNIQPTKVVKTIGDKDITYEHRFTVSDNFDNVPLTPARPVLSIALGPNQIFKQEDFASQLKCQISTPTSTQLRPVDMKFVPSVRNWFIELKDIASVAKWSLNVVCTQVINKVQKYGLEISPVSTLSIAYIDFVDGNRYSQYTTGSSTGAAHKQTDKQTGSYPGKVDNYVLANFVTALSHGSIQKLINDNTATVTNGLTKSVAQTKYTITPVGPTVPTVQYSSRSDYGDVRVVPMYDEYIKEVYGKGTNTGDYLQQTVGIAETFDVSPIWSEPLPSQGRAAQVKFSQLYLSKPDADADFYNPPFNTNFVKELKTQKLSETLVPVLGGDSGLFTSQRTKFDGCGYSSIYYSSDFETGADENTEAANWANFIYTPYQRFLCTVGEKCSVNADCDTQHCLAEKCQVRKFEQIPYLPAQTEGSFPEYIQKQFYNSATSASVFVAAAAVVVAIFF